MLTIKYNDFDGAQVTREYPQYKTLDEYLAEMENLRDGAMTDAKQIMRQILDHTDKLIPPENLARLEGAEKPTHSELWKRRKRGWKDVEVIEQ